MDNQPLTMTVKVEDLPNIRAMLAEALSCLSQIADCGCEDPGPEVENGMRCRTTTKGAMEYCNPCLAKHTLANIEGMSNPKGK